MERRRKKTFLSFLARPPLKMDPCFCCSLFFYASTLDFLLHLLGLGKPENQNGVDCAPSFPLIFRARFHFRLWLLRGRNCHFPLVPLPGMRKHWSRWEIWKNGKTPGNAISLTRFSVYFLCRFFYLYLGTEMEIMKKLQLQRLQQKMQLGFHLDNSASFKWSQIFWA